MPCRCGEGGRHPLQLRSTPGTPAGGDRQPLGLGGSSLQQGWVLQAQGENVLQRVNNRVSCRLPFVVGPALIALEGLGVSRGILGKGGLRRRRGGGWRRGEGGENEMEVRGRSKRLI